MRRVFALAVLAVALAGCSDATGPTTVTGSWNLQTVNNQSLPYTMVSTTVGSTPYKYEITGMTITVNSGGSYTTTMNDRTTQGTTVSTSSSSSQGTWTQSGTDLTFTDASDSTSTSSATISGNVMLFTETTTDPNTGTTTTLQFKFAHS